MADAGAGGHDAEIVERRLAPFQEGVALHVALIFAIHVHLEGARIAEFVDHHRMVDDQIDGVEGVDLLRIAAQRLDAVAHRGKVDHGGNAGEILHQHARRAISDLARVLAAQLGPIGECLDVLDMHGLRILEAEHVLQHHLQRGRQAREIAKPCSLRGGDGIIGIALVTNLERATRLGGIVADGNGHESLPSSGHVGVVISASRLPPRRLSIKAKQGAATLLYAIAYRMERGRDAEGRGAPEGASRASAATWV